MEDLVPIYRTQQTTDLPLYTTPGYFNDHVIDMNMIDNQPVDVYQQVVLDKENQPVSSCEIICRCFIAFIIVVFIGFSIFYAVSKLKH